MSDAGAARHIFQNTDDEQHRLLADSFFAFFAVLRGKSYERHDERSESVSDDQLRILQETANNLDVSLSREIAELEKTLFAFCSASCTKWAEFDANSVGEGDCRAALVAAVDLLRRRRTSFDTGRTLYKYDSMRIEGLNKKWQQMYNAMTELESHATEISADNLQLREELRKEKAANDALKERLRICSDMLKKGNIIQSARQSKKKPDVAAELERSIAAALSQFDATKKKCAALAKDLNDAKHALRSVRQELCDADELKGRLREMTKDCAAKAEEVEALSTKLRCSICDERDKDAAFACGYTFCRECATACAKCPLRCESEQRHKPVKHTFRIYL